MSKTYDEKRVDAMSARSAILKDIRALESDMRKARADKDDSKRDEVNASIVAKVKEYNAQWPYGHVQAYEFQM